MVTYESESEQKLKRYLFCSQDICTLNITMNNSLLVQIDQTFQNLFVVMNISYQDGKMKENKKENTISDMHLSNENSDQWLREGSKIIGLDNVSKWTIFYIPTISTLNKLQHARR